MKTQMESLQGTGLIAFTVWKNMGKLAKPSTVQGVWENIELGVGKLYRTSQSLHHGNGANGTIAVKLNRLPMYGECMVRSKRSRRHRDPGHN